MSIIKDGSEKGGYVFISHSHQDIVKVRQIRNAMEEEGYEPLCFYLKCLTDEDEIEGLIKREIDAREWFVYVDSPNARASAWVRKEREYISSLGTKQIITVDLEGEDVREVSEKLIRGLRVLILCGEADMPMAGRLQRAFLEKDMQAYVGSADAPEESGIALEDAGCIVVLISGSGIKAEEAAGALPDNAKEDTASVLVALDSCETGTQEASLERSFRKICHLKRSDPESKLEEVVRLAEYEMTHDLRQAFTDASSHSEAEAYYLRNTDDPEAARLLQEAQDRLDEEQRIKEDILESIERGTMKMTEELKKYLES